MPSLPARLGWVILAALLASSPAAVYTTSQVDAPLWYLALMSLAQALGISTFAIGVGVVILLAARERANGGLKAALIAAVALGALVSFSIISTAGR